MFKLGLRISRQTTVPDGEANAGNTNSVLKTGAGTTTLTGTHTYTGVTTIHQGPLALGATGSIANSTTLIVGDVGSSGAVLDVSALSGGFTVGDTQTLGGTGSITGAVIMDGILSPGASIESLSSGALTFNSGSTFAYEMDSGLDPSVAADLQIVNGDLTLNGQIDLTLSASAFAPNTTTLSLIQYTGDLLGAGGFFFGTTELTDGSTFNDGLNNWKISYASAIGGLNFATSIDGSHFITLSNLTAIPEPASLLALGCLVGSGVLLRTRRVR